VRDRYFFDKRDWKRRLIKYIVCIAVSFIPTVLFNVYVGNKLGANWLVIMIDCAFILVVFLVSNLLLDRYFAKKDDKLARIRKEREELDARKKQILEDSYKQKRLEKERIKQEKLKRQESNGDNVEEIEKEESKSPKSKSRKK
jgi:mannitol-specific phosphotransferase system IIBC component